jgi:glycosyltransferase involved in cell wall biosynthesis
VHSITPKAGLLAMVASRVGGVPVRVHTFTGQVWATRSGLFRRVLRSLDRVTARCATFLLVDSHSQREFLLKEQVVDAGRSAVLLGGSVSGVDIRRFTRRESARARIRQRLGINVDELLLLFVGRLNRDKGVLDLARAFVALGSFGVPVRLMFIGGDEGQMRQQIESIVDGVRDKVAFIDFTPQPEEFMWAADVLCLPSYREGFGSVVIEAAAAGTPAVGSRIYGLTDAIADGVTGLLHEPGNVGDIVQKLRRMIGDPDLRNRMAEAARHRAAAEFDQSVITAAILDRYSTLLAEGMRCIRATAPFTTAAGHGRGSQQGQ